MLRTIVWQQEVLDHCIVWNVTMNRRRPIEAKWIDLKYFPCEIARPRNIPKVGIAGCIVGQSEDQWIIWASGSVCDQVPMEAGIWSCLNRGIQSLYARRQERLSGH